MWRRRARGSRAAGRGGKRSGRKRRRRGTRRSRTSTATCPGPWGWSLACEPLQYRAICGRIEQLFSPLQLQSHLQEIRTTIFTWSSKQPLCRRIEQLQVQYLHLISYKAICRRMEKLYHLISYRAICRRMDQLFSPLQLQGHLQKNRTTIYTSSATEPSVGE